MSKEFDDKTLPNTLHHCDCDYGNTALGKYTTRHGEDGDGPWPH